MYGQLYKHVTSLTKRQHHGCSGVLLFPTLGLSDPRKILSFRERGLESPSDRFSVGSRFLLDVV